MKFLLRHSSVLLPGIQFLKDLEPGQKRAGVTGWGDFI